MCSKRLDPIYRGLCPICGGDAYASELLDFGNCGKCGVSIDSSLNAYSLMRVLEDDLRDFTGFFAKATNGLKPWGAQVTWVKRLLNGENTVIIAPTGMGKTTLLMIYSLYHVVHGRGRVLYLAPTRALAKQIFRKLIEYSRNICGGSDCLRIVFYDSGLSKKKRLEILDRISRREYDILILTNHFLIRRYDLVAGDNGVNLIIIDDVDSLMRSSRNVLKLMKLLGYSDELIEKAKRRNSIIWKIMLSKSLNRVEDYQKYVEELIGVEEEINKLLSSIGRRQVVVASATGRMRGVYAKIMRDLLRIDVSGITIYGRNITDTYLLFNNIDDAVGKLLGIVRVLGNGGLFFISPRHPLKDLLVRIIKRVKDELERQGYRVAYASPNTIKKFISGEYDFLIGSSSYYGVSVRGIDAPETIKYVVFFGTPLFSIGLEQFLASPNMLIRVSLLLSELLGDNGFRRLATSIRKLVFPLSSGELRLLSMLLKNKITPNDLGGSRILKIYDEIRKYYEEIMGSLKKIISVKNVVDMGTITFYHDGDKYYALIPDVMTYIQASGRCSRLYLGRMTHGLSIILEYNEFSNLVNGLSLKMSMFSRGFGFKSIDEVDLSSEKRKIISSRRNLNGPTLKYRNILVVVESPTKAKTIARFFGKPVRRRIGSVSVYEIPFVNDDEVIHLNIMATRGHLFDLTTDPSVPNHGVLIDDLRISPVYESIKRCRICGYQFTHGDQCPRCGSRSFIDSFEVVSVLRKLAGEADEVYIATDPDIEGEKIAYDVYLSIKGFTEKVWRIELHEITLNEFLKALRNKRSINYRLVEAEIYRRVLDRVIGFSLSHELWRKYSLKWLGAGRVQTPVLGWIINRYREYLRNKCRRIVFKINELKLTIPICIDKSDRDLYGRLKNAREIMFEVVNKWVETVNPKPPYTTDELLYDASRIGIPASLTMKIAQELFESGLITYHRTSYHHVSSTGIGVASKYLKNKGLDNLFQPSHWGGKGAHEAIRPVHSLDREDLEKAVVEGILSPVIPLTWIHYRIYDLIFRRFIASQMRPYKILIGRFKVFIDNLYVNTIDLPIRIVEDGFNKVLGIRVYEALDINDKITFSISSVNSRITSTIPLYSEGGIVKAMKDNGLGRPSTYSKILSSIIRHGYVIRSKKKGFLIPTKRGVEVYEYISSKYPDLVSVETTRRMEELIDAIASGEASAVDEITNVIERVKDYGLPLSISEIMGSVSA
jgi:reverse gyrase